MPRARKLALALVGWVALFEASGWIADAHWQFRYALLDGLDTASLAAEPIPRTEPEWAPHTLRVRVPDMYGPRDTPYVIGGVTLPDAWPDAKQDWISPSALEAETRQRVFVVGGSAALGYPYAYEHTFERRLETQRPDLRVVNVGQAGWASGQVLGVAERVLADFDPDVLVVFVGNNEWIRWQPEASASFDLDVQRTLARSRALAGALYLGHARAVHAEQDARPLLGWEHALATPDHTLGVARWRAQRAAFLDAFRAHLSAMRDAAREHGVRLLVLTVPFQYRLSPSWKHAQPDAFDPVHAVTLRALEQRAGRALREGRPSEALRASEEAIALDPEPAILHHLRGAALEALGRMLDAEAAYADAREHMVGNLGARLSIDRIVEEVASADELVDVRAIFDAHAHASGGWFLRDLIHDDCHPTPLGHQLVADALAERIPAAR